MKKNSWKILALVGFAALAPGVALWQMSSAVETRPLLDWRPITRVKARDAVAARIVAAAKEQFGTRYDASYRIIGYPRGDVAADRGACTDVVVRALRGAGYDLQKLVHEDMQRRFAAYPQKWKLDIPNTNIDHRRVPNLMVFFQKHATVLPTEFSARTRATFLPGDIICWSSGSGRTHTGIVSDGVQGGVPLIIHNNSICHEENCLLRWPIIGHYRFPVVRKVAGKVT